MRDVAGLRCSDRPPSVRPGLSHAEVVACARGRLPRRVWLVFDTLLRIVTMQLLQVARQLIVDIRAAIKKELLETALSWPGLRGRLHLHCLGVTVEWRVGDGEVTLGRRRNTPIFGIRSVIKVGLELGA